MLELVLNVVAETGKTYWSVDRGDEIVFRAPDGSQESKQAAIAYMQTAVAHEQDA